MVDKTIFGAVYKSILRRDTKYDGIYYTGIKTTGIVCRPSCKSKVPKKENVTIYPSLDEAITAGFRPCKRCQPEQLGKMNPDSRIAHDVKTFLLKNYDTPITLKDISREILISPYHLQRIFKREIGSTPHQFLLQIRLKKAKELLEIGDLTIAKIAKMVGFQSISHFSMVFKKEYHFTTSKCTKSEGR